LGRCRLNNAQRFVGQQSADAPALVPRSSVFSAFGPFIRGDHSPLRTVHEDPCAAALGRDLIVKRADEVRAANAHAAPQHFRMDGIIDQGGKRLAGGIQCLNDIASLIIKMLSVIIEGDLSFRWPAGDLELSGLQIRYRLVNRLGHPLTDHLQVFGIAGSPAFAVGKPIAVRSAVRVGRPDQNVLRGNAPDRRPRAIAELRGKAQEIRADNRDSIGPFLKNQRAYRQVAVLARDRAGSPNTAHDRQEWIGRYHAHGDGCAKAGRRVYGCKE
jgi:hypothetical protein